MHYGQSLQGIVAVCQSQTCFEVTGGRLVIGPLLWFSAPLLTQQGWTWRLLVWPSGKVGERSHLWHCCHPFYKLRCFTFPLLNYSCFAGLKHGRWRWQEMGWAPNWHPSSLLLMKAEISPVEFCVALHNGEGCGCKADIELLWTSGIPQASSPIHPKGSLVMSVTLPPEVAAPGRQAPGIRGGQRAPEPQFLTCEMGVM